MLNNTSYAFQNNERNENPHIHSAVVASAVIMAFLSPVAVMGNVLILVAVWKKTFERTSFHILLTALVLTDLFTGLIPQPVNVATILLYTMNSRRSHGKPVLHLVFQTIADASATYFISVTILILTLMSVERWLHMSQRSLVTSCRGCFVAAVVFLIPAPIAVCRSLETLSPGSIGTAYFITIVVLLLLCFVTIFFAYFKVLRIIHFHQVQVQANQTSRQSGHSAINLAKYKKSIITILYVLALFCICFLPFAICVMIYVSVGINSQIAVALSFSLSLLFLSSSINPFLYLWRMNDVRNGVKQLFC